jgi:hypothetical protein
MVMIPLTSRALRSIGLVAVAVWLGATSEVAAQTKPKPKPNPNSSTTTAPLPGVLLITADDACTLAIDGQPAGTFRAGETKTVRVALGKHVLRATSAVNGAVSWAGAIELKAAGQEVVSVLLKDKLDQTAWLASHAPPAGVDPSQLRGVSVEVDPTLWGAAQPQVKSLESVDIHLEALPTVPTAPVRTTTSARWRAVLLELSSRGADPVEVAGVSLKSCSVRVGLSLWTQTTPTTWTIDENGAAIDEPGACTAARRKAVASAFSTLVTFLRKDKR